MGPRPGEQWCLLDRLFGPEPGQLQFVIDAGSPTVGPISVRIEESDFAFWSLGCPPRLINKRRGSRHRSRFWENYRLPSHV